VRSRQGIATEAALASREWVFAALPVDHVISLIHPDNAPSLGVAEKLGMTVWKEVLWGKEGPRTHLVYRSDRPRF
jgi:RimJ/RimL family protein N-acetyltransferase